MSTEARAVEAAKAFNWRLEIDGVPAAMIQKVNPGSREVGITKHAGAGLNHPVQEAGMLEYGAVELEGILPIEGPGGVAFEQWLDQAQDPKTGRGGRKSEYCKDFTLHWLGGDKNPFLTRQYRDGWCQKVDRGELDALNKDGNVIDKATIVYDWYEDVAK